MGNCGRKKNNSFQLRGKKERERETATCWGGGDLGRRARNLQKCLADFLRKRAADSLSAPKEARGRGGRYARESGSELCESFAP